MHKQWFNLCLYRWNSCKRTVTSCFTGHLPQSIGIFRLSSRILYADNLTIIYSADNSYGTIDVCMTVWRHTCAYQEGTRQT